MAANKGPNEGPDVLKDNDNRLVSDENELSEYRKRAEAEQRKGIERIVRFLELDFDEYELFNRDKRQPESVIESEKMCLTENDPEESEGQVNDSLTEEAEDRQVLQSSDDDKEECETDKDLFVIDQLLPSELHAGHRSRLRKRLLSTDISTWSEHEAMESMLYFTYPRKDTNELAHRIINHFGSLDRAINADVYELQKIDGVTETMAEFIALFRKFITYQSYLKEKEIRIFSTFDDIYSFMMESIGDAYKEIVCIYFLTSSGETLTEYRVEGATPSSVSVSFKEIATRCLRYKVASVLVVHTHPSGFPEPSPEDDAFTKDLMFFLEGLDVALFDHIIWADKKVFSYSINGRLKELKKDMRSK